MSAMQLGLFGDQDNKILRITSEDEPCGEPGCKHKAACYQQEIGPDAVCIAFEVKVAETGLRRKV